MIFAHLDPLDSTDMMGLRGVTISYFGVYVDAFGAPLFAVSKTIEVQERSGPTAGCL